jgi:hypothetical protein
MKLTAAPVVRQPMDVIGAPGKTDFTRIFIASELNRDEYRTTLRHEQAHVWAGHNRRRPHNARSRLWDIACEMEIARTIYDSRDLDIIAAPRSRLAGGYLPDSLDGLPPDALLAEVIYEWLLEQPDNEVPLQKCCVCSCVDDAENEQDDCAAPEAIRDQLDADEAAHESQIAAACAYDRLKNRAPSLTEAVDAALRVRIEREKSYRRPSRRCAGDIISHGAISTPRPPLVEIFVDRSGSFTPEKTAAAERQLGLLLSRYGATIRSDVWFFGNGKLTPTDPGGGGDTPYPLIAQHIIRSAPKLAIVITDNDPVGPLDAVDRRTIVLCVPIGCHNTTLAKAIGGRDVVTR